MVRCSTPSSMREEDWMEEKEADSAEANRVTRLENTITTISRRLGKLLVSFTEGGSILPDHATKTTRSNAGYCGKLDHYEEECRKKKREAGRQLTNYATNSDYGDRN